MKIDVALVGRESPGEENLGLRYVAGALERAGHRPRVHSLCRAAEIPAVASELLQAPPPLLGLAIADAPASVDLLTLAKWRRQRGYSGHITCGGALATLVRHQLLARHGDIDSVIRHDGEIPCVHLADCIAQGGDWRKVAGLTTQAGDGQPAPVASLAPLHGRPLRPPELQRIVGIPAARVIASRGCAGDCRYCGSVALRNNALREAVRAGLSPRQARAACVGTLRRRAPDDLADEVATLYHDYGARIFHLLDDNVIGKDAVASQKWLRQLVGELRARGVQRSAWSLMTSPTVVTEDLVDVLEQLGVVRVLVGIEALTAQGLTRLGRPGSVEENWAALELLQRRGIVPVFNSIVVDPDTDRELLAAELEALQRVDRIYFEINPLIVYPGTPAFCRLHRQGRVSGGMLGYRYEAADVVATRFAAALLRLNVQTRWSDAGLYAHEVATSLAILGRLQPGRYDSSLQSEVEQCINQVNQLRLSVWHQALALASTELPLEQRGVAVARLVHQLERGLQPLWHRVDQVQRQLVGAGEREPVRHNILRTRAHAAGFAVMLAAAACGGGLDSDHNTASGGDTAMSAEDASVGGSAGSGGGSVVGVDSGAGGTSGSGGLDVDRQQLSPVMQWCIVPSSQEGNREVEVRDVPADMNGTPLCAEDEVCAEAAQVVGLAEEECELVCNETRFFVDPTGLLVDVEFPSAGPGETLAEVRRCMLETLANERFPCLAGGDLWTYCYVLLL
jgi:anaerobic magnesium-protoporphyrin IX monomethyl ester cyclase